MVTNLRLNDLLRQVSNTSSMPTFRNIDRYINPSVRRIWKACDELEAMAARREIGPADVELLIRAYLTGNDHVAGSIIETILKMGSSAVPVLSEILSNGKGEVQVMAGSTLGMIGGPALAVLERTAQSANRDQRKCAVLGLVHSGSKGLPILSRLLSHSDFEVGISASYALTIWKVVHRDQPKTGVDVLLSELRGPNRLASERAAYGLGFAGGEAFQQAWMELPIMRLSPEIDWESPVTQAYMARVLDSKQGLKSADRNTRIQVAYRLGQEMNPLSIPVLFQSLRSEVDEGVRAHGFWALWRLVKMPI